MMIEDNHHRNHRNEQYYWMPSNYDDNGQQKWPFDSTLNEIDKKKNFFGT